MRKKDKPTCNSQFTSHVNLCKFCDKKPTQNMLPHALYLTTFDFSLTSLIWDK